MKYYLAAALILTSPALAAVKLTDPAASGIIIAPTAPNGLDDVQVDVWYEGTFTVPDPSLIAIDDRIDTNRDTDTTPDFFEAGDSVLDAGSKVISLYFNITEDPVDGTFDFYDFDVTLPGAAIAGMAGIRETLLGHENLNIAGFSPLDLPNIANSDAFVGVESDHDSVEGDLPTLSVSGRVKTQNQSDGFRVFLVDSGTFNVVPEATSFAVWGLLGGLGFVSTGRASKRNA